jgi:hypothetical protein
MRVISSLYRLRLLLGFFFENLVEVRQRIRGGRIQLSASLLGNRDITSRQQKVAATCLISGW